MKKRKRIVPMRGILKARCEFCGTLLVKAPKLITKSGKVVCKPCGSQLPDHAILRRC